MEIRGENMNKVEKLIDAMLEYKFFRNNWYNLSEEDKEEFKKDLLEKINEEV